MNIRKSSSLKTSLSIFKPWIATFHGAFAWNCAPLVANQLGHRPLVEAPVPSWKIQLSLEDESIRNHLGNPVHSEYESIRTMSIHEFLDLSINHARMSLDNASKNVRRHASHSLFCGSAGGKSPRTRNSADLVHLVHFCSKWQTQNGKNREQTNTLSDCLLEGCVAQL